MRETTPWEESGHAAGRPEAVRAERFRATCSSPAPTSPGCSRRSPAWLEAPIDIKELSCKQFPVWLPDGNKQDNFHMRGYVRAFETVDVKAVRSVLDDLERKHKIKVILDTEMRRARRPRRRVAGHSRISAASPPLPRACRGMAARA